MNKYLVLLFIVLSGCCTRYNCEIDSAFNDVIPMVNDVTISFEKIEKQILNIKPDDVIGPHPDPAKCVCKGTGLIEQGDKHVTKCPYHGTSTTILKR